MEIEHNQLSLRTGKMRVIAKKSSQTISKASKNARRHKASTERKRLATVAACKAAIKVLRSGKLKLQTLVSAYEKTLKTLSLKIELYEPLAGTVVSLDGDSDTLLEECNQAFDSQIEGIQSILDEI